MSSAGKQIGGLFITSFSGERPTEEFLRFLTEHRPAGVILFAEHCRNHSQLANTITQIQQALDGRGLIAIDQEGGRVCRVSGAPAEFGSAESYASRAAGSESSKQAAFDSYREDLSASLRYLRDLGFTFWLGPVCDLQLYEGETALETRTFGSNPKMVSKFVEISVEACHNHGMVCCLKHAPGLGRVTADPHHNLGVSAATEKEFLEIDATPFRAGVKSGSDAIMTSHFLLRRFDEYPVTFSQIIVEKIIRAHLSRSLPLVSDDMQMGALEEMGAPGELAARALFAGHDLLLTRSPDVVLSGIREIERRIEREPEATQSIDRALKRVHELKGRSTALLSLV